MNDLSKVIARKILDVLREQAPGDIAELRRLAEQARRLGDEETARTAEEIAGTFEQEDG